MIEFQCILIVLILDVGVLVIPWYNMRLPPTVNQMW